MIERWMDGGALALCWLVVLVVATGPGTAAFASEILFASDVSRDLLLLVDEDSCETSVIGSLATPVLASLAIDPATGVIYGTDTTARDLVTVDPFTAEVTVVGSLGFSAHASAIDPATGELYVMGGLHGGYLYRVDKTTAAAEFIADVPLWSPYGMDFDPETGQLYVAAAYEPYPYPFGLFIVDPATGDASFVAETHRATALAFDEQGQLYTVDNNSTGSPSTLYRVDKVGGHFEEVCEIGPGNVLGLLFDGGLVVPVRERSLSEVRRLFGAR